MKRSIQTRPAVWLLIVAALLLRAGIPVGWMPVAGDDGLRFMLCSGSGPVEIAKVPGEAHHEHHQDHQNHEEAGHEPCPFGLALGKSFNLLAPPVPALLPAALAALVSPMLPAARYAERRNLRPPARGPPAFA
ncbi:MAG: DUF2946 family protein [Novosphingobium sp.]|nr:DUF2946 family protein [Novosphingobium sp.]